MGRNRASKEGLGRKGNHRQKKSLRRVIYIFCEGKTEKSYFSHWKSLCRAVSVEIDQKDSQARPKSILRRADNKYKSLSKRERENSEIWVVFDRDDHHNWKISVQEAHQKGFGLALSTSCFELWGVLHFTDKTGILNSDKTQEKLHQLMPSYHHNDNPYFDMKLLDEQDISLARERALKLQARIFQDKDVDSSQDEVFANPSTTVWMLLERLEKWGDYIIFQTGIDNLSEKEKTWHQKCWQCLQPENISTK